MTSRVAVLANGALVRADRQRWAGLPAAATTDDLHGRAKELGVRVVFVQGQIGPHSAPRVIGNHVVAEWIGDGEWRFRLSDADGYTVTVVGLVADVGQVAGPWAGLSPAQVLDGLDSWHRATGCEWSHSTGRAVEELIVATHPLRKGGRPLELDPERHAESAVPELAGSSLEMPYQPWVRDWSDAERLNAGSSWVHVFDANAQYLAAWGAAELGHGTPAHHRLASAGTGFDRRKVGFWRMPGLERVRPTRTDIPRPELPGREWFSTPTMLRIMEVYNGADLPDITEALVWPESSRYLRSAGERLRDARQAGRDRVAAALTALGDLAPEDDAGIERQIREQIGGDQLGRMVRAAYTVGTGRFSWEGRTADSPWRRPDWGHLVRATARANLHRRIEQMSHAPFMVNVDALWCLSEHKDPVEAANALRVPLGDGLGRFRSDGNAPAEAVAEAMGVGRPHQPPLTGAQQLRAASRVVVDYIKAGG